MRAKAKEADLQKAVEQFLATQRDVWFMRANAGDRVLPGPQGRRYRIRGAPKGTADIVGCCAGVFFGVELKAPRGKSSLEQQSWGRRIRGIGGIAIVARSVSEVREMLDRLRQNGPKTVGAVPGPKPSNVGSGKGIDPCMG